MKVKGGIRGYLNEYSPLVSVVTVVYNDKAGIERTIESIIKHRSDKLEYLIIDGGSTDGTLDILQKYNNKIDYWHSESDQGIYDAMNKSILLARGSFILNINVGDELYYIPFELLQNYIDPSVCAVCAAVKIRQNKIKYPKLSFALKLENTIPHQGCFYNVDHLKENLYDISYKVFSDFDLNQRLFKKKYHFIVCREIVSFHSPGGISYNKKYSKEFFSIILKNYGIIYKILSFLKFKYYAVKYLFR